MLNLVSDQRSKAWMSPIAQQTGISVWAFMPHGEQGALQA